MKTIIWTVIVMMNVAFAPGAQAAACAETIKVNVNGLVCDFCARALEKVFGEREDVTAVEVDLDNALVSVHSKAGSSLDDATLSALIRDSGYDVTAIERSCK